MSNNKPEKFGLSRDTTGN